MKIHYLGQSCFLFITENGVRIVTDPYHSGIGIKLPKLPADIVTLSHDHFDHNNLGKIQGEYRSFKEPGDFEEKGIRIQGFGSYHDGEQGRKRGTNVIFRFEADGLRICHLGDLGHVPDEALLAQLRPVDILLLPVGEVFTFDVNEALETMRLIAPKVTIPMHYKAKKMQIGLETEQKFLKIAGAHRRLESDELQITPENLESYQGVLVMNF